ncbi:N-formylglutamate amidohydrolase [Novosphingobium sp. BL-52-GroH]|uniref:N-formylglutamate amidohydrolase n=1 Tax=Novosphingobium sp. BL-52-GroH TaxID=3349877 RepID=UPI00384C5933
MAGRTAGGLLGPDDPAPFGMFNAAGSSPFLLIGDHAGHAIPRRLGGLGLAPVDMERHIAIDIGVLGLGKALARRLDAPFVHQAYSRLVIDCNRDPARPDAIPEVSDGTRIAGNEGLENTDRKSRIEAIHRPYHAAIAAELEARHAAGRDTVLVSLHSFTPVMDGIARPWHAGILHWTGRTDFAHAFREALRGEAGPDVGDNVPYAMDDTDYTVPLHAIARNLRYVEIEVRQDLIGGAQGQALWARRLGRAALAATGASLGGNTAPY